MSVKRIGVLTSGGDAPGMNPVSVRSSVLRCIVDWNATVSAGAGTVSSPAISFVWMKKSVSHTINQGGTILYTARSQEFMTEEGQRRAVSTCKFLGLDSIIAIGGDGTFRGAQALSKYGINVIGIPGTIDNDISCTNYCIGFDTAANTAIECIDKLRDTMQSHERCSVVEVMGRNAGYLAMYVGLAVGATAVLVPEEPIDFERDVIEKIRQARFNGFTHYMIVVAEGAGSAADIAAKIKGRHRPRPPRDRSGSHSARRLPHRTRPRQRHQDGLSRRRAAASGQDQPHRLHPHGRFYRCGYQRGLGYEEEHPEDGSGCSGGYDRI